MDAQLKNQMATFAIVAVLVLVAIGVGFSLDLGDDDEDFMAIDRFDVPEGTHRIVLEEDQYQFAPLAASLLGNRGIHTTISWSENSGELENIQLPGVDLSYFSSQLALTYWVGVEETIVVDSYEHAVMMSSLALYKDIPILVYGETTTSAIHYLGSSKGKAITLGDVPFKGQMRLTEEEVVENSLDVAVEEGRDVDYITVVNPWDHNETIADVPHQSALAPVLNSYRGGVVLACPPHNETINLLVHETLNHSLDRGMDPGFICMYGDAYALPFIYAYDPQLGHDSPTDNVYADLDGNPWTVEKAIGRIVGSTLGELSRYHDRVFRYQSYLDTSSAPLVANPGTMGFDWNNNGLTYCGTAAEFAGQSWAVVNEELRNAGFDSQDDSPQAHSGYPVSTELSAELLCADFARANYIFMDADHGNPYRTANFWGIDLQPMYPGVFFAVSCSLGRIDLRNFGEEDTRYPDDEWGFTKSVTYCMMRQGMNCYFGAMRTAWGTVGTGGDRSAAPGLCYFLAEDIFTNDLTTGEALMNAKASLIAENDNNVNRCTTWEYNCFGDPAFNPYEPCNEGS